MNHKQSDFKLKLFRFIAILLLVLPGWLAVFGFLEVKDALFNYFSDIGNDEVEQQMEWLKLLLGIVYFAIGVSFIGGWVFFRDRKRNYVAPRFKEKKKH